MVQDHKGNKYKILEQNERTALLKCERTGGFVRLRGHGWASMGFYKVDE